MELIRICIGYFFIYRILMEWIPAGSFRTYFKWLGSMLFLLLFFQNLLKLESVMPDLTKHYYENIVEASLDAGNQQKILEEYQRQVKQQMREYLEKNGYEIKEIDLSFDGEEIKKLSIWLKDADDFDTAKIKKQLSDVYSLEKVHINVRS